MEILYIVIAVALVSAGVYWRIQYTSDNRPVGKNASPRIKALLNKGLTEAEALAQIRKEDREKFKASVFDKVPQIKSLVDSGLSFDQAVAQYIEDRGEEDYLAKLYPDDSFNF
jgi:uncharacterized protein YoaH (UPF0181 family)